jgi:glycosyltransferase involved in cell wall biosynthesis
MIKICLVAPVPPPYGGIANWTSLIVKHILEFHKEVSLEIVNIAPSKRMTEGRSLWSRVFVSGFDMLKKRSAIKKILRDKPDAVHMTTSGSLALIRDITILRLLKKHNTTAVYHIRFGRIPNLAKQNGWEWKLISIAMKIATSVVTIDRYTYATVCERLQEINCLLLPNPVDMSGLPKGKTIRSKEVLFLGWVVKEKGIEELIEAWNAFSKNYPDYILNVMGPSHPEYLNELRQQASQSIIFHGEKNHDVAMDMLSGCDALVLPSYSEGFPNVVVEAMAMGRTVIASSVGAIPDMLANDCGILISPGAPKEIECALRCLALDSDKCLQFGINAYQKAVSQYSLDTVYAEYEKLWNLKDR